ncbi:hypothetical protein EVAR_28523_1 [Eumeta japonica]|uniref:Uncharacterized protein n=1 Tax=Eumeta variegata TaxID=151549 RepID=A0A4C1WQP6_EUMVA|nr:hypothetical protein EVAR_28523_1 [Eumeta japonica]
MLRSQLLFAFLMVTTLSSADEKQSRWSRQISSYVSDISDWIPLTGPTEKTKEQPMKRQVAQPRILTEPLPSFPKQAAYNQDAFPGRTYFNGPNHRQLYLQSVPSAPQNFLTDQGFGQSIKFGLSQPNFPLSQGFVGPPFAFDNIPQFKPSTVNFPKSSLPLPLQAKPFVTPQTINTLKSETPDFLNVYRTENSNKSLNIPKIIKPQSLQKLTIEPFEKSSQNIQNQHKNKQNAKIEREEVQLLYVPVESLNRGQFNFGNPLNTAQFVNSDLFSSALHNPNPIKQSFVTDFGKPQDKPVEAFNFGQNFYSNLNDQINLLDQMPKFSTVPTPIPIVPSTTVKPKKLKPHQPPLAVFLTQDAKKGNLVKVSDVLYSLKNAQTIAVLDSVSPDNSPNVFIGPSSLKPPENYVKFELPYLSNIEHSDRKLRQLPFFVAPLSYNTPDGFAKIPFPSPHVGSVIINSEIKDVQGQGTPTASIIPNSYTPNSYNKDAKQSTPQFSTSSYFTTLPPKTNPPNNFQSTYYSLELQTITSVKTPKAKEESIFTPPPSQPSSYYLSNNRPYVNNLQNYLNLQSQRPIQNEYDTIKLSQNVEKQQVFQPIQPTTTTTQKPITIKSTTSSVSTYPTHLLETHNPYSINQAFHLSTPLDYQNYFDEYKESVDTQGVEHYNLKKPSQVGSIKEKENTYTSSSPYLNNYKPEIQYESAISGSRPTDYSSSIGTTQAAIIKDINTSDDISENRPLTTSKNHSEDFIDQHLLSISGTDIEQSNDSSAIFMDHGSNLFDHDVSVKDTTSSTTTTTTTTRRPPPLRTRSRPRYTTARSVSKESSTKMVVTRRPLKERRPLPSRTRYELHKGTTERTTKSSIDISNESSTRYSKSRTRGRVQYKPADDEELREFKKYKSTTKEDDLAYQRDVLHQNYPVTLMERISTANIVTVTESTPVINSTKNYHDIDLQSERYDNEQAYTVEKTFFSQHSATSRLDEIGTSASSTRSIESETEVPSYVSQIPSSENEEYFFQPKSETTEKDTLISFTPNQISNIQDISRSTSQAENSTIIPDSATSVNNQLLTLYTTAQNDQLQYQSVIETHSDTDYDITKAESNIQLTDDPANKEEENSETVLETTSAYVDKIKSRPQSLNEHHIFSSESPLNGITVNLDKVGVKRRLTQPITFRPAFDRRRTTMRIEEIEADLKTKPVHTRTEQAQRQPIYKPDTTESSPAISQEIVTRRTHYRRRRPINSYSTTSTESSVTQKIVKEVKNRYKGRRPTEKTFDKIDSQSDITSTTTRIIPINRYNHRNRLSERFNRKPSVTKNEDQIVEDQDSNYSINSPRYAAPEEKFLENEKWSPNVSVGNFKPYNPNDVQDEGKSVTTENSYDSNISTMDIITARNDYDDILIPVTPASNRLNKNIPEIPPTLEALVEQSKNSKNISNNTMSSFESMLEEVMKSLEEQDENEYTSNVMKHKGGEIGEIPPEETVTSGEKFTKLLPETTVTDFVSEETTPANDQDKEHKNRRRGFWKKVKVRPLTTESIEVAESQFYSNTVNHLGGEVLKAYNKHKEKNYSTPKPKVTTYRPNKEFKKHEKSTETILEDTTDSFQTTENTYSDMPDEIRDDVLRETTLLDNFDTTSIPDITRIVPKKSAKQSNPGDVDLGTGSPDSTIVEKYSTPTTEPVDDSFSILDRSDSFSGIMDYFFGMTSSDSDKPENENKRSRQESQTSVNSNTGNVITKTDSDVVKSETKINVTTTENNFMPEEITTVTSDVKNSEKYPESEVQARKENDKAVLKDKENNTTQKTDALNVRSDPKSVESSSVSGFWDPSNVVSTSMSTMVSHETEICFRGKCIKTSSTML